MPRLGKLSKLNEDLNKLVSQVEDEEEPQVEERPKKKSDYYSPAKMKDHFVAEADLVAEAQVACYGYQDRYWKQGEQALIKKGDIFPKHFKVLHVKEE